MDYMCLDDFRDFAEELVIVRDGAILKEVYGVKKVERNTKYFDFYPGTDIRAGDWIHQINTGEMYYVYQTDTDTVNGDAYAIKGYYWLEKEYKANKVLTLGISNLTIGCEQCYCNKDKYDLDRLKLCIDKNVNKDSEILKELIDTIKLITLNNVSIQKGTLNRYRKVLSEYKWLNQCISKMLIGWLTSD